MENKELKKEEKPKNKKNNLTKKLRENPWILSTFVLGIMILILLIGNISGIFSGKSISSTDAGNIIIDLAKAQIGNIEITNVEKENGLYKINYYSDKGEGEIYLTLDGKNLVNGLIPIDYLSNNEKKETTFTEEQNILIKEFSSCLYNKGMRVYYAGWCGHCHNLIETFGGLENAGKMMIECQTENGEVGEGEDLCEKENISGFPTIKINGEKYSGPRTFEAFAEATGCTSPEF